jgi:hypothetical protein
VITRIHVNQHTIKANRKHGRDDPVLSVKRGGTNTYAHEVAVTGPSRIVYRPDRPLSCGARCWVETESEVLILR